jgi:hypothetical protein
MLMATRWWIIRLDPATGAARPVRPDELPPRPADARPADGDPFTPYYRQEEHAHLPPDDELGAHVRADDLPSALARALELVGRAMTLARRSPMFCVYAETGHTSFFSGYLDKEGCLSDALLLGENLEKAKAECQVFPTAAEAEAKAQEVRSRALVTSAKVEPFPPPWARPPR